jgi:hypothetical protein
MAYQSKKDYFKIIDFCNFKTSIISTDIIKSNILEKIGSYITNDKTKSLYVNDLKLDMMYYRLRTNGIKANLYLTTNNGQYLSYIIEQNSPNKVEIINCKLRFKPEIYSGTLFTGELVYTKQKTWEYLITDVIIYKNKLVDNSIDFIKKLNLSEIYKTDKVIQYLEVRLDNYLPIENIKKEKFNNIIDNNYCYIAIEFILKQDDNTLGKRIVYFDNFDNMLSPKIDIRMNKEQNIEKEFIIKYSGKPDIYYLSELDNTKMNNNNLAYIKDLEMSRKLRLLFNNNSTNEMKVKCIVNKKFNRWQVISVSS